MIRMAIIGYGVMGRNHFRHLCNMDNVDVVSICEPETTEVPGTKLYRDLDAMLSSESIDAAILSAPIFLHKDIGIRCIEKGIDLLIEKPIAANSRDGLALKECAAAHNTKMVVGYTERFNPVVLDLRDELMDKEIYSINITRIGPIPPRIADVGVLTDMAVHDIDLITFITNSDIVETKIFKSQKIHNHYEDNAVIAARLENDVLANITSNWLPPFKKRMIEIATNEGYYEANLIDQTLIVYSSSAFIDIDHSYVVRNCFVRKGEALFFELEAFIDYLANGSPGHLATADDSIRTLEICES